MKIFRSIKTPIREFIDMDHRWRNEDNGLIWCWERGRQIRVENPKLAQKANAGELVVLSWKGGVPEEFKGKKKEGTYNYLAQWQGLAGKDLNIDTETPITFNCSATDVKVTYSKDGWKIMDVGTTNFFALDVETANANMSSICQIGIVEFSEGKVINQWETYVNPQTYFDPFNVSIHGISEEMVKNSPRFPEIYSHLQKMVDGQVVVTHMPFDQTSLQRSCEKYALPKLECAWFDSARLVRRHWEQFRQSGYSLPNITAHLGIQYKSHSAVEDARAAGEVVSRAIIESGQSLDEWRIRAYKQSAASRNAHHARAGNPDGSFYGETIVFTGSLSMPRATAANLAAQAGCNVSDSVNKNTTILVIGIQSQDRLAGYEKSSKHRKAEELANKGQQIKIIAELDFFELAGLQ